MSSRSGGLLELVARGKKDILFTANPQISFFHSVYLRCAAFAKEIYTTKPRNAPEWGRTVDFEIDHRGDIMKQFFLRIQLPTWIPLSLRDINRTGIVTDPSGVTYGYCNNIGYQMIEKIQLLNDNVLIHETYGEHLDWRTRSSYSYGTTYLNNVNIGSRAENSLAIGRSSTAGELRVPIPILGWQSLSDPGLPLVALRNCRYRLRLVLRPYSALLTASDGRLQPSPFGKTLRVQTTKDGPVQTWEESALLSSCMKQLDMSLEATVLYLPNAVNTWLKATTFEFPFRHVQYKLHTIEDNVMNAVAQGANLSIPVKLDFSGPADRLLIGFRSDANTLAGQRNVLTPPTGMDTAFISTMRLNIANIDRIQTWEPAVFREVTAYWKSHRMPLRLTDSSKPDDIYTITFGGYDYDVPAGTLSFSRAIAPTLYIVPAQVMYDTRNISRKVYCMIYAETWNVYTVGKNQGALRFDDS